MNRLIKDYPDRAAAIPVGTFGSVRQIADAAVYLFSEAGDYINGATLVGKTSPRKQSFLQC